MNRLAECLPHLYEPETITGPMLPRLLPVFGRGKMALSLNARAAGIADMEIDCLPATVVIESHPIQGVPMTDYNLVRRILQTAEDLRSWQKFGGSLALMAAVDGPSFNPAYHQRHALEDMDVEVVEYYQPLDAGLRCNVVNDVVSNLPEEPGVVVPIAAGARFATDQALRAASLHVGRGAVGVFGPRLLGFGAGLDISTFMSTKGAGSLVVDLEPSDHAGRIPGYMSYAGAAASTMAIKQMELPTALEPFSGLAHWAAEAENCGGRIAYEPGMAVHSPLTGREATLGVIGYEILHGEIY